MGTPFIHSISEAEERELTYASLTEIQVIQPKTACEAEERGMRGASLVKRWGMQPKTVSEADERRERSASLNWVGSMDWVIGLVHGVN